MEPEPSGAAFFCLEPEPTQLGRSRLRDLGHPEPELPEKVAALQHWGSYNWDDFQIKAGSYRYVRVNYFWKREQVSQPHDEKPSRPPSKELRLNPGRSSVQIPSVGHTIRYTAKIIL